MDPETRDHVVPGEERRSYERPSFAWEESFAPEASLSSACAKLAGQSPTCNVAASS